MSEPKYHVGQRCHAVNQAGEFVVRDTLVEEVDKMEVGERYISVLPTCSGSIAYAGKERWVYLVNRSRVWIDEHGIIPIDDDDASGVVKKKKGLAA